MHIVGSILCLAVAVILSSVAAEDWSTSPAWVTSLTVVAIAALLASAVRIYVSGARRKWEAVGPRTRIVIGEAPSAPRRSTSLSSSRRS